MPTNSGLFLRNLAYFGSRSRAEESRYSESFGSRNGRSASGVSMQQQTKKSVPIGVSDFERLIRTSYFVDKSRFIKEILDNSGTQVTLITRPRRFGKTLMLSMLWYFFSIENSGQNRGLFSGLEIETYGRDYLDKQGAYPVISFSLKEIEETTYKQFLRNISRKLSNLYTTYEYILNSDVLSKKDKVDFDKIYYETDDEVSLVYALYGLIDMLAKYYNRKVIVLIDEYDTPIIASWKHAYYEPCIQFMRKFLGACLKDNKSVEFAVITGITRISKESIFSGLNNFEVCSCLSDMYSDIFGFMTDEVSSLMEYYDVLDKLPELKKWYDGYIFGRKEIYNPWSVMKYLSQGCDPHPYWVNTSGNTIVKTLLRTMDEDTRKDIELLLQGGRVQRNIDETLVYGEIEENNDALFSMLVSTGYLKVISKQFIHYCWSCILEIPNLEILNVYKSEVLRSILPKNTNALENMLRAMLNGDEPVFQDNLQQILLRNTSYFDLSKDKQEAFFHGLVLGFTLYLEDSYQILSNRESGKGRFDILLLPRDPNSFGILLELKVSESEKSMERDAVEAVRQMNVLQYETVFLHNGIKNIWKYGISFHKKDVCIVKDA